MAQPSGFAASRLRTLLGLFVRFPSTRTGVARGNVQKREIGVVDLARPPRVARQFVLRSRWQYGQPRAREQNTFLKTHSWEEYAMWHLGLTEGAAEETRARYAFVYGDFRRVHRIGLIACHHRAAEWRHKEVELAAYELLQYLDRKSAS